MHFYRGCHFIAFRKLYVPKPCLFLSRVLLLNRKRKGRGLRAGLKLRIEMARQRLKIFRLALISENLKIMANLPRRLPKKHFTVK